ncbi:MAG: crossover junction endodeoxyribonuclease RuvC [Simkaniaceae bacterium]|nr:crossover junction endodeoxyribonuclease RuvC [Candidatus Sacchlamyda saccharinae]
MIILGIDPGTRSTGYGIIDHSTHSSVALDYGCIRPPAKATSSQRYLIIFEGIEDLIAKHKPKALAVESQFMHKNALSAMKLGMARAMAILAAERAGIPIYEYAPKKAKKAVVGTGGATKSQVQKMIQVLLNLSELPTPDDAADALALALCHAHEVKYQSCLST